MNDLKNESRFYNFSLFLGMAEEWNNVTQLFYPILTSIIVSKFLKFVSYNFIKNFILLYIYEASFFELLSEWKRVS